MPYFLSTAKTSSYLHTLPSPSLGPSGSRSSFPWQQVRLVATGPPASNVPDLLDNDCPYQWVRRRFQSQLKLLCSTETESQWFPDAPDSHATQRGNPDRSASTFGRGRDEGTALVRVVHLQEFRTRYVKYILGEWGWCSGERTRLLPVWCGFIHHWYMQVSSMRWERFSPFSFFFFTKNNSKIANK